MGPSEPLYMSAFNNYVQLAEQGWADVGKVRTGLVKKLARKLVEANPEMFTADFEVNKQRVKELNIIESKKLRNRVAGYITRLMRIRERSGAARR